MKSAVFLLSALVACLTARANADGVCYDPNHGSGMSVESVKSDLQTIKAKGFSHVRTYISYFGADLADLVVKSGLRAALGIPTGVDDRREHIDNAIKAAKSGMVDYIFVGNENAEKGDDVLFKTLAVIKEIKEKVPGVRVGTVQRTIDYTQASSAMREVVKASDVVGVNIHPFFHPNTNGANGVKEAQAQWQAVLNSGLPGIASKLILSETGWPSGGSNGNQGTPESAATYWQEYKKWNLPDNQRFYFQMFDTPYKGGFEAKYGLLNADSSDKFGAGGNPAPAPTAAPTPVPTTPAPTTPAPTTPAPTTPAPSNATATASLSGSAAGEADVVLKDGSGSVGEDAGTVSETDSSLESETESTAENEAGVVDMNGDAATDSATNAGGATRTTGDNKNSGTVEATTKSGTEASSPLGVIVVAVFGVAAVGAAFAFIYKARQKAAELESSERKSFDSFAITPGGGCAL